METGEKFRVEDVLGPGSPPSPPDIRSSHFAVSNSGFCIMSRLIRFPPGGGTSSTPGSVEGETETSEL